ncbi:DNA internalization-related competence protein ComEC/Rec2 [Vibrio sp. 05-20-BW147]|uniref:DNA internalization-related competence protein ComEC/Rec2 n=1 Tax=Vibrio sp. 05-20-BW147 TaxID=2575834 RepID=UPI001592E0ED|nr:DNA internalization-related competence protein ComEC/Rec2 [Vibrio sp. 05-20-BW147]NVC63675.1 DNA internalization-related competence protein ComEC/Rec2 [Vibrio sp. 05-20-BW147]
MTLLGNNWLLASFSATLISASYWPLMPSWPWLMLIVVAIFIIIVRKTCRYLLGVTIALLIAISAGNLMQWQVKTLFQAGENITINGAVDSPFKQISHGYEGVVSITAINNSHLVWTLRPKVRLISPIPLGQGDQIVAHVTLKRVYGLLNEAGFDAERFAVSQGIVGRATIDDSRSWRLVSVKGGRQALIEKAQQLLVRSDHTGYLLGLSFGLRDDITDEQWQQLKQSGLIHLLSISGLHIGMAFGIGYWLGHWLRFGRLTLVWLPMMVALGLSWSYAWLAGFTIPTQRAVTFCTVAMTLHFFSLTISRWTLLLAVLAICLLLTPFAASSASLWLSFLAVVCVFLTITSITTADSLWGKIKRLLLPQCLLIILLSPITAYFFGGFSLTALAYNLVFIPWFTVVVVPLMFASLAFTALNVEELAGMFWKVTDLALQPLTLSLPYAEFGWWHVSGQTVVLLGLLALLLVFRHAVRRSSILVCIGSVLIISVFRYGGQSTRIDVLDVGHGLSVLIEKQGKAIVYDTGKAWQEGSIAEQVIEPILVKRGIHALDGMIISHQDNDHAGGADYLEVAMQPKWMMSSDMDSESPCVRGVSFDWQSLYFEVLWPPRQVKRAYNPHSCVVRMWDRKNQFSFLMTGDIDALAEWILVREPQKLASDVVLVPHHGSHTSSVPIFVASVNAQLAIASVAKGNQWNMPKPEVVDTYLDNGTQWLDTGEEGQVTLVIDNGRWHVSSMRKDSFTAWYRQMLRNQVE